MNNEANEKLRTTVALEIHCLLNGQIAQPELFHGDNNSKLGLNITLSQGNLSIDPIIPLEGKIVRDASYEDAKQAIELLAETMPNFDRQFTVQYEEDAIHITKKPEVKLLDFLD